MKAAQLKIGSTFFYGGVEQVVVSIIDGEIAFKNADGVRPNITRLYDFQFDANYYGFITFK